MDLAYDSITKASLPPSSPTPPPPDNETTPPNPDPSSPTINIPPSTTDTTTSPSDPQLNPVADATPSSPQHNRRQSLNAEFQEAYTALSATPWGAKMGGWWSSVRAQGGKVVEGARAEGGRVGGEAFAGLRDLGQVGEGAFAGLRDLGARMGVVGEEGEGRKEGEDGEKREGANERDGALKGEGAEGEGEGVVERFRAEAAKRLKDLERAEEAADAAIIRFGSNLGNFLKDAVTVAPPSDDAKSKLLFESKGEDGKRVIHSTRLEAQLHAIHTSQDKFLKDPEFETDEGKEKWDEWKHGFDVEKRTNDIARDLDRFEELRRMMEKSVPEKVEYKDFWRRYYFLRDLVESEEQRRREVLKGAAQSTATDEIAWDDDSDSDTDPTNEETTSTPQNGTKKPSSAPGNASPASLATIHPPSSAGDKDVAGLKPQESSRRSQDEKSQPDSEASYDLVSGATSMTPGSPNNSHGNKSAGSGVVGGNGGEEEEDWE